MNDVAIVGIGCRFPGDVNSPIELWNFLLNKGDGMVDVPSNRWSLERFYDPDPDVPGRMYTKRGGFLSRSFEEFDPEYFGISPREATIMDPQQRLLLEVTQETLDDAGLAGHVAGRPVGVYVGGFTCDSMVFRHTRSVRSLITTHTPTSSTYTMLSNRISYAYDLRGPSMTIDTACSSSLVALDQAFKALNRGDIEMALVGGANAMLRPETFISMCKGRFLAKDGRCKTFDKDADGYARGEGAGMVMLRPLNDAIENGDRIYAVVKMTGTNQDGRTSGITVPNPKAQAELIKEVTEQSGISPAEIGFVEAHGTGTVVGDPLELNAIGETLGAVDGRDEPLRVGSIKASIGHLEAAAGVASVIKAALTLHHGTIVPQAWLNELNPNIPFDNYQIKIPLEVEPFPEKYAIPMASVNGFGYGGTNAHAILAAYQAPAAEDATPAVRAETARFFPVSGRNDAGAREFAKDLAALVEWQTSTQDVDSLADGVWNRREHQLLRFAVPYKDKEDLLKQLNELAEGRGKASVRVMGKGEGPAFVFSGMGPQWWAMARQLLTRDSAFSRVAREIDEIFTGLSGWSLIEELLRDKADSSVGSTRIAQSGNLLVQAGLAAELAELGVKPTAIVGHSVGEVSAAYLSGMLSLREAVTVSFHRARLQEQQAGTGGMLAIGLSETDALQRIQNIPGVCIAAINSPAGVTLSGDTAPLQQLAAELNEAGVFNRELRVEVPYHSHLMDPILDEVMEALADLKPKMPHIPLYSTVSGKQVIDASELWDASYWVNNIREPVRFADAITSMIGDDLNIFLEVGPHPALSGNVRQVLMQNGGGGTSIPTLVRNEEDIACLRKALAELYAVGALDLAQPPGGFLGPVQQHDYLPVHKFQRDRLWTEHRDIRTDRLGTEGAPVLPGMKTSASSQEWECTVSVGALPWLHDHVVSGAVLLPGAAYVDSALATACSLNGRDQPIIEDIEFISPLVIGEHEAPFMRMAVDNETGRFSILTSGPEQEEWTLRAKGRIVNAKANPKVFEPVPHEVSTVEGPSGETSADEASASEVSADKVTVSKMATDLPGPQVMKIPGEALYKQLDKAGLSYGPYFRRIQAVSVSEEGVIGHVDGRVENNRHQAHPAVIDCALQCMAAWAGISGSQADGATVPAAIKSVRQFQAIPDQVVVRVIPKTPRPGEADLIADIALTTPEGESVLELTRVQFRPISPRLPVLKELAGMWYEPVYTPISEIGVSDDYEREYEVDLECETDKPDASSTPLVDTPSPVLFVVGFGESTQSWVSTLTAENPLNQSLDVSGSDPAKIAETVRPALYEFLAKVDSPVTVVVCSAGHGKTQNPHEEERCYNLDIATAAPAALAGTALAVQEAVTELEEGGTHTHTASIRGLVLTHGALAMPGDPSYSLANASVVGARRVIRNEDPGMHWSLIDIDDRATVEDIFRVMSQTSAITPEIDEIVLRDGIAHAYQVQRTLNNYVDLLEETRPLTDPEANFAIEKPESKLLSDLSLREIPRLAPGEGEIELRLDALELNYKDSMKVIGVLTEKELSGTYFGMDIGMGGIGEITRVGPGVKDLKVGDRMAYGVRGMAQRYVITKVDDGFITRTQGNQTLEEQGALVPMLTAAYSVFHAARVQPGEVVLVHGGAGGVGMASIQVAKAVGARVISTARTPERREFAREMGADEVLDSRSINFVEDILKLTDGHGADVIISSAPGEIIEANLEVAAEFGRVVEVGKQDIFFKRPISLAPFEKNLSFISIDIDRMTKSRPELVKQLQREITQFLMDGNGKPMPSKIVPLSRMSDAFEMVGRSTHVGRVLLDFRDEAPMVKPPRPTIKIHPDASYLITGGFGAFGLATARWLADEGARTLVMVSRSGAKSKVQLGTVEALRKIGVEVVSRQVDMSDLNAVTGLIEEIGETLPPLKGIFHTAGVVQDGAFTNLTEEAMRNVLAPKALGAINLHLALKENDTQVDYFVLYSSITAMIGTVPQTSYAAANCTLDTLAMHRRAQGLPATSVNWGALSGGGMAENSEEVARYLDMLGLNRTDMDRSCEYMGVAMGMDVPQAVISNSDWSRWSRISKQSAGTFRFDDLVRSSVSTIDGASDVYNKLLELPSEERVDALTGIIAEQIASVLGIPADSVDPQTPLPELGLDSLMAVELNMRINASMGVEVTALEFTRGGGIASLSARLLQRMEEAAEAGLRASEEAFILPGQTDDQKQGDQEKLAFAS